MQEANENTVLGNFDNTTFDFFYVYGIALNSVGQPQQALQVLQKAQQRFPYSLDILSALVSINREMGNEDRAICFENRLQSLH